MAKQIRQSFFQSGKIFFRQFGFGKPAVHFQGAHGSHHHRRIGHKPRHTAFDIEKLFRSEIRAETRFRNGVFAQRHRRFRGDHGIAAVRDIRKRSAVYERGRTFQSLHEIRLQCVF